MEYSERVGCHAARLRRAFCAWVTFASLTLASVAPLTLGHTAADPDFGAVLLAPHDHAAHRLDAGADPVPDHCLACHLTRETRHFPRAGRLVAGLVRQRLATADAAHAPRNVEPSTGFTRGPPSLL